MIPARHWSAFETLFSVYASWTLKRHFHAIHVRGSLPRTMAPLLVVSQHIGWWDPILFFYLSRSRFPGKHFVMMDEANLRRLGFFRWLGAFGIDRSGEMAALDGMRYAMDRLKEHGSRVWVFPQGKLQPADLRPLGCHPGAVWLARRSRAPVVAVAIRYEFREAQHPEAFVSFGEPTLLESHATTQDPVEDLLTKEADRLQMAVWNRQLDGFDRVMNGRRSISALYGSE